MKKIKVLELFSGIGAPRKALMNLGVDFEIVDAVEFDAKPVEIYNNLYGENYQPQDITQWDKDIDVDMIIHGSPCFTGDTLVLTDKGYKQIKDIDVGDKVLSHTNQYRNISALMNQGVKRIYEVKAMGVHKIETTENHKFYVVKKDRIWNNEQKQYITRYSDPHWVECKDLTKNHYTGYAINQNAIIPKWDGVKLNYHNTNTTSNKLDMTSPDLWYLAGRYCGDGWVRSRKERNSLYSSVIICCGKHEKDEFESKIGKDFLYTRVECRTTYKYQFTNKELAHFMKDFGMGASNKIVPAKALDLPINLLSRFLDGYFDADGSERDNVIGANSISEKLIYGIKQAVAKVYGVNCGIAKTIPSPTKTIEGRLVNQQPVFQLRFRPQATLQHSFIKDNILWCPIRSIRETEKFEEVYDITVDEDHSFTANGMIVHNCQSFSISGKQEGGDEGSGTRSSLMYETVRIVTKLKPRVVIWENVKNVLAPQHIHNFENYLDKFEDLGYSNFYKVTKGQEHGIPQARERLICVSILNYKGNYEFKTRTPIANNLIDYIDFRDKDDLTFNFHRKYNEVNGTNITEEEFIEYVKSLPTLKGIGTKKLGLYNFGEMDTVTTCDNLTGTLTCRNVQNYNKKFLWNNKLYKPSPKMCFKLMGFSDEDFEKVKHLPDKQLYNGAGNSIIVNVLEDVFSGLFKR